MEGGQNSPCELKQTLVEGLNNFKARFVRPRSSPIQPCVVPERKLKKWGGQIKKNLVAAFFALGTIVEIAPHDDGESSHQSALLKLQYSPRE